MESKDALWQETHRFAKETISARFSRYEGGLDE
jgi:hypothetical protein